ncbi:hypothetical protein [Streptomyces antarcticus]|uniref:hypothetical protein n=1 Tax=Streptomyces antarcticus TaxID=2996458 RepID=UPI002271EC54|nr:MULTISPECIES: hypothetical protein [unclassified Streptomyces]MCY0942512.1 hypothetical protein [Streptomyces sp. H34-AA3]MCZ4083798.1 hypothetical protein [Streptomyces sp. H34-S5]
MRARTWAGAAAAAAAALLTACDPGPAAAGATLGAEAEPARSAVAAELSEVAERAGLSSAPQLDLPHQRDMRAATGECIAAWDSRVDATSETVDALADDLARRGWTPASGGWYEPNGTRTLGMTRADWEMEVAHVAPGADGRLSLIATQRTVECLDALSETVVRNAGSGSPSS